MSFALVRPFVGQVADDRKFEHLEAVCFYAEQDRQADECQDDHPNKKRKQHRERCRYEGKDKADYEHTEKENEHGDDQQQRLHGVKAYDLVRFVGYENDDAVYKIDPAYREIREKRAYIQIKS